MQVPRRLAGQRRAAPTVATGNVSVPRRTGPVSTVAYMHGTAASYYDAPSKPRRRGRSRAPRREPGWDDILTALPPTSRELLRRSYVDALRSNPADPMRIRLRQNAVDRWCPEAPIRMYHSPDDEEVPYKDAVVSINRLRDRGADVALRTVSGDHVNSWVQALPRAAAYFATLD